MLKGWWMLYAVAILAVTAFTFLPDIPRFYFLGVERDIFVIAISAAALMAAWFLYYNFPKKFIVWFIWAGLSQNLMDELVFNPYEYQWNEYITITVLVVIYLNGLKNKSHKDENIL